MVGLAQPFAHQRHMPVMQRAHGRYEGNGRAIAPEGGNGGAQRGDVTDDLHVAMRHNRGGAGPPVPSPSARTERCTGPPDFPGARVSAAAASPHIIVFANEKGGTGKSTCAVHVAVALSRMGARVSGLDLDHRQRTFHRYMENRAVTAQRRRIALPAPRCDVYGGGSIDGLQEKVVALADGADFLVVDTPGRDDRLARHMVTLAHTLVTPINDSFVDFDLIGQVDGESFKVQRASFYAEAIWNARKARAAVDGGTIDWIVLRNRTQNQDARNMRRVTEALAELSRRVGFRTVPGLSERVIYRELFPSGLTLLDRGQLGDLGTSHIAARQELREMMAELGLPMPAPNPALAIDPV